MLSPNVVINSGFPNITTTYPSFLPTTQFVSASALTPSSLIPVSTVPTVSAIANLYTSGFQQYPSVVSYQNVNTDPQLRSQVTDYFFSKLLKNWLRYHYLELYQLVIVVDGKAKLIQNLADMEKNTKNVQAEDDIKFEFIVDNYITKNDLYKLLEKFRKENNLNWWDLKHHQKEVRKFLQYKIKKCMKSDILNSK
jgi:hypothetical protein